MALNNEQQHRRQKFRLSKNMNRMNGLSHIHYVTLDLDKMYTA